MRVMKHQGELSRLVKKHCSGLRVATTIAYSRFRCEYLASHHTMADYLKKCGIPRS